MNKEVTEIRNGAVAIVNGYQVLLNAIKEGEVNDIDIVDCLIKNELIVKATEEFKKAVKPFALRALETVTDKTIFEKDGVCIKVTTTPSKYDFSVSQDWRDADEMVKTATEKRKAIEKALKDAHINEYVDKASGEIISAVEKVSGGEKTVQVTIIK